MDTGTNYRSDQTETHVWNGYSNEWKEWNEGMEGRKEGMEGMEWKREWRMG